MRFLKKLTDWKTWVFTILPLILFAIFFALLIYAYKKSPYNAPLIISAMTLLPTALILINAYPISLRIKQKHYIRGLASIAFILLFLGLQIVSMVMLPKLIETSQNEQNAYQNLLDTSFDDENRSKLWDAWEAANEKAHDIDFKMEFLYLGSMVALAFAEIICPSRKRKTDEDNIESGDNNTSPQE